MPATKMCSKCNRDLPAGEFYPNERYSSGLMSWCKTCNYQSTKDTALKRRSIDPVRFRVMQMLKAAKQRARKRGVPFDLLPQDIVAPVRCPALGMVLDYDCTPGRGVGGFSPNSPSLDRIVPARGYVKGNVAVISNRANILKRDQTLIEAEAMVLFMRNAHKYADFWE